MYKKVNKFRKLRSSQLIHSNLLIILKICYYFYSNYNRNIILLHKYIFLKIKLFLKDKNKIQTYKLSYFKWEIGYYE